MSSEQLACPLTAKDFTSDQEVRWCPGCGDRAIVNTMRKVLAKLGKRPENTVFVSGIGCSSRFPCYMATYGFHGIHGRAPAIATGVKVANPELDVWVVTGDGDGLSIGGNHLVHLLRRNLDLSVLLFNNKIYGLTKGQYSPTSEEGKKTKSSPQGSIDLPMTPLSIAMGAEAGFAARAMDMDKRLADVLERAAFHRGTSFVEIYQDCNVFNHGAFEYATSRKSRDDAVLYLEHGQPMIFGAEKDKGLRLVDGIKPEVVQIGEQWSKDDLLVHDETSETLAFMLTRLRYPDFPEPMGVFHAVADECYEDLLVEQIDAAQAAAGGAGDLRELLVGTDSYQVD